MDLTDIKAAAADQIDAVIFLTLSLGRASPSSRVKRLAIILVLH